MDVEKELMPLSEGFPRPDWDAISKLVEAQPEQEWQVNWERWAKSWVAATADCLPDGYKVIESKNFLLLSSKDDHYLKLLNEFLERSLNKILTALSGIASDDGYGKHVVFIFDEQDSYYRYKSYFYPDEGEFILSAGTFLNTGYGHFAFPYMDMDEAEATSAHELTHACLAHLPIPLWLNEGLAVTMESSICGWSPQNKFERFPEHVHFWNTETIQEYWSGEAFNRGDEGSGLSYELAGWCVEALAKDYDSFIAFTNAASHEDAGEPAATDAYGFGLGVLLEQFFGGGDWSPKPSKWEN